MLEISRRPPLPRHSRGHRPFCPAPGHSAAEKGKRMGRERLETLVNKGFGWGWGGGAAWGWRARGGGGEEGARGKGL